jgi:hypothetical protein
MRIFNTSHVFTCIRGSDPRLPQFGTNCDGTDDIVLDRLRYTYLTHSFSSIDSMPVEDGGEGAPHRLALAGPLSTCL